MSKLVKMKFVGHGGEGGKLFHGHLGRPANRVSLGAGETVLVTEEKARELEQSVGWKRVADAEEPKPQKPGKTAKEK